MPEWRTLFEAEDSDLGITLASVAYRRKVEERYQANALIEPRRGDPEAVPGAGSILGFTVGFYLRLSCAEAHHMDNGI
jgi:hypothetical protein